MNVPVTRSRILNFEKNASNHEPDPPFFFDWISIHQDHSGRDLPFVSAGVVWATDEDGAVTWKTVKTKKIEGSHETSVQIRCDGQSVKFEGNVSRFGRTDNVWGFSFSECLRIINRILSSLGLPPFTSGEKGEVTVKTSKGKDSKVIWSGARITRLDLTANYQTGSISDARAYMRWLENQQPGGRIKVGTFQDGETVDWGRGSKFLYSKVYLKSTELKRRSGPQNLIEYTESIGLIRFEITVKSKWLFANSMTYLGAFDMTKLIALFNDRAKILTRAEQTVDDLEDIQSRALRCTARDYLAGDDLSKKMSTPTFYRHRSALLPYGIDISVPLNIQKLPTKVRVIELQPAKIPDWYQFHQPQESKAA